MPISLVHCGKARSFRVYGNLTNCIFWRKELKESLEEAISFKRKGEKWYSTIRFGRKMSMYPANMAKIIAKQGNPRSQFGGHSENLLSVISLFLTITVYWLITLRTGRCLSLIVFFRWKRMKKLLQYRTFKPNGKM